MDFRPNTPRFPLGCEGCSIASIVWRAPGFGRDTDLTCVSESGRVLQKKKLNNSNRILCGQDTGQAGLHRFVRFLFSYLDNSSLGAWDSRTSGDIDFQKTPPPNFSGTAALSRAVGGRRKQTNAVEDAGGLVVETGALKLYVTR